VRATACLALLYWVVHFFSSWLCDVSYLLLSRIYSKINGISSTTQLFLLITIHFKGIVSPTLSGVQRDVKKKDYEHQQCLLAVAVTPLWELHTYTRWWRLKQCYHDISKHLLFLGDTPLHELWFTMAFCWEKRLYIIRFVFVLVCLPSAWDQAPRRPSWFLSSEPETGKNSV